MKFFPPIDVAINYSQTIYNFFTNYLFLIYR